MWNYIRFSFVIVGIILLFSDDSSIKVYGLLLFFLGLISYVGKELHNLASSNNINNREVNCRFDIKYDVKAILESNIVEKYFKDKNFIDYRKELDGVSIPQHLIENYEIMLKDWKINPAIKINVKGKDVYIDEILSFENNIHHTIFIPFDLEDYDPDNYYVHAGVTIRAIMLNGFLRIQVWYFSNNKMTNISTETLGSDYHTYKSFYDLFLVPIIYSKPFLGLSRRHLNIVAEWIEGYYNSDGKRFSDDWKKKWQKLHTDLSDYEYLNSLSDDWWSSDKRWMKILTEFWAIENQYTSNNEDDEWDYESRKAFWLNYISDYSNEYATIKVSDLNNWYEENYKKYSSWIVKEEFIP